MAFTVVSADSEQGDDMEVEVQPLRNAVKRRRGGPRKKTGISPLLGFRENKLMADFVLPGWYEALAPPEVTIRNAADRKMCGVAVRLLGALH